MNNCFTATENAAAPEETQFWTVPSCSKCNSKLSSIEKDLLIRLALCLDPSLEGASGLGALALRSIGIETGNLSRRDKFHRDKLKVKLQGELIPYEKVVEKPGAIPGLRPQEGVADSELLAIPIPYRHLSRIAEKMTCGCEYKLRGRYLEAPYAIHTLVSEHASLDFLDDVETFRLGPVCSILRASDREDSKAVVYKFLLWESICLSTHVNHNSILSLAESVSEKVKGYTREQLEELRNGC